jgi:hypothetical protein
MHFKEDNLYLSPHDFVLCDFRVVDHSQSDSTMDQENTTVESLTFDSYFEDEERQ